RNIPFCHLTLPPPPTSPLFPYTTLFRSIAADWNDSSTGSGSVDSQLKAAGLVIAKDENTVNGQYNSFNNWDPALVGRQSGRWIEDRKSTRLNSSHVKISYAVFCLKKKKL